MRNETDRLTTWCHVHEGLYQREPGFMSSPLAKQVGNMAYPVMGCPDCCKVPGAVRAAYLRFIGGAK